MTGVEPVAGAAPGICRACRTRDCCRSEVALTGDDVVRIARALQVTPAHFAELVPVTTAEATPASERIHLGGGAGAFRLVLRRRETEPGRGDRVCTFLLELRGGRRLCGLAELAPTACALFPRDAHGGLYERAAGVGCWRDWRADEAPRDLASEARARDDSARWAACIAAWNAIALVRPGAVQAATFLEHLFTAYA